MTPTTNNTTNPSSVFKRVISNPDQMLREAKITKMGEIAVDTAVARTPTIHELSNEETMLDRLNIDDNKSKVPVATLSSRIESMTDSSLSDDAPAAGGEDLDAAPPAVSAANCETSKLSRTISHESQGSSASMANKSVTSNSSEGARVSVGNWGWFEDVHGHESVFLPGARDEGEEKGEVENRGGRKKGGLLQMGSALMPSALYTVLEPQRDGISPDMN
ncbi:hypothetical protein ACHAWX_003055 [Stephanocyclus meneghinianus]